MRGEETQISGFLRSDPGFSGVICLPGTHTKWALIKRGVVEFFTTFMTGELFSFLEKQSVLKHSFSSEGWNGNAFKTAVNYAISKPEKISSRLFSLRAGGLISDLDPVAARSMASGYLIGLEMAAMKDLWRENKICLIGASALTKIYVSAFHEIGVETADYDVETMTLAGLAQAYSNLSQSEKCTG
jgi:2-dehydro-3-deoxygalactonokinase